jgi:hypothetical protein
VPTIVPALAVHVTVSFEALVTAAVSGSVSPAPTVLVAGVTTMPTGVTVTVADALRVASATLVAVIV